MKSVLDPGNTGNSVLDGKDASKFGSNSGSSGGSSSSSAGDEGSSGGGSFGWLSLLPLAFAAMQRRRKAKSCHGRCTSHGARAGLLHAVHAAFQQRYRKSTRMTS